MYKRQIAEGREAAISIHRFVHSNQSFVIGRDKRDYKPLARSSVGVAIDELESAPRQAAENGLLSDAQLHCEAERCLGCGTVVLNEDQCIGCGICTTKCEFDAIHLKRVRPQNSKMIPAEDKFKAIGPYAAKRQVKIIKKSLAEKKK